MYDTLTHISTVLFILSGVFAASAAAVYYSWGLADYRAMIRHGKIPSAPARAPDPPRRQEKEIRRAVVEESSDVPAEEKREDAPRRGAGRFTARTVSESDAVRKGKEPEAGEEPTERLGAITGEEPDGVTSLEDGSDDTMYLRKTAARSRAKEDDAELWMPPSGAFRPGSSEMVIHTDRMISDNIGKEP